MTTHQRNTDLLTDWLITNDEMKKYVCVCLKADDHHDDDRKPLMKTGCNAVKNSFIFNLNARTHRKYIDNLV